ncbi:MAG TPA: hypothetical protein VNN80_18930, partial [Polyangiaceae bacterium]|nr:hypothetical protein [Polyangiaceae bacterium]
PPECPSHAAWRSALRAHSDPALAPLAERLAIEIERQGSAASSTYEGRIRQSGAQPAARGRSVRGATCREVFEALALIGRLGLARGSDAVDPAEPPGRSGARAPNPAPLATASGWVLTAREEQDLARDPVPEPSSPAPQRESVRLAAAALAFWGGASRATAGADLGLALSARWNSELLQPFVLVGAYGGRERFGVSGTSAGARLERLALHAVACPLRFPREASVGLRPCVDLDAGVLRGSGVSVDAARGHDALWLSTGLQLRAEWSPWGPLELAAMVGGVVALSRPRFYFVPDTTAFQADALAVRAGASAGVSF